MIKIKTLGVWGIDGAMHGMRDPMNSWDKNDTVDGVVGSNDKKLSVALTKGGGEERKHLRYIHVHVDINAPLYWWKEFDTYKVGTTSNSCSTMHKIHAKVFTLDDFSHEHLSGYSLDCLEKTIEALNIYRDNYLVGRVKAEWWQMIQLLPSSYNQLRTIDLDYETLLRMYQQRKHHKLDEWRDLCKWILELPQFKEITNAVEDVTDFSGLNSPQSNLCKE